MLYTSTKSEFRIQNLLKYALQYEFLTGFGDRSIDETGLVFQDYVKEVRTLFGITRDDEKEILKVAINEEYSSISIEYGERKMLFFASNKDLDSGQAFMREKTPNNVGTVASSLLLHGTIGSNVYGQNIPFVALYYS